MKLTQLMILGVAMGLLVACVEAPETMDLAIENVTLVDAVNVTREGKTVIFNDGFIVDIIDAGTDFLATETIDATGKYLIPGLWDFHVHFTYDSRFTDAMAGLFLYHGVTNVRDTGGLLEDLLPVVDKLRAPEAIAPAVWYAGPLLDGSDVVYDGVNLPGLGIANSTPEAARANIAVLEDAGASFLKIYEMVTPEVFEAIVNEAGQRGLPIDGHVPLSMRAREVASKVQSLEHLRNYELDCVADPEALLAIRRAELANEAGEPGSLLRARLHRLQRIPAIFNEDDTECLASTEALKSTISVPTLRLNSMQLNVPLLRDDFDAALALTPESVQTDWSNAKTQVLSADRSIDTTFDEWSMRRTGELHAVGAPIAAGTDTPIGWSIPGYSLHTELEQFVMVGMTPREALYTATRRPAEFFGLEGEMGELRAGFIADAVLLDANPLQDITNTRRVRGVVHRGRFLDRLDLDRLVAE
ncbi:MAG: amidohydrolase family protein [Pseudomonadota bacterium]|nr:amidohydrolase family protein [Pseudomonadota bacterium]